jgi:hypothetical protein
MTVHLGTGKSFIGAIAVKTLYNSTKQIILVVCFTNHALDQFTEDLIKIGIPMKDIIRLGGKSTEATKLLTLREQKDISRKPRQWAIIDELKRKINRYEKKLQDSFKRYQSINTRKDHLMEYLEFLVDDLPFFEVFKVPKASDGMTQVGRNNRKLDKFYLLDRWVQGAKDAGPLQHVQPPEAKLVWDMSNNLRTEYLRKWQKSILEDIVVQIQESGRAFNELQAELERIFAEHDREIICSKRIIACTTNGAAKFASAIQSASPGIGTYLAHFSI